MPFFDLIIFDLDGTLVDSRADLAAATNRALRDLGLPSRPVEEIVGFVGDGLLKLLERALGGPDRVEEARPRFEHHYRAGLLDRTLPYPGIDNLVRALARDRVLSVASNKPGPMARDLVAGLGWSSCMPQVVGGGDVAALKPAPDMVEHLWERTGCRRDRTVLVGDMEVDFELARIVGIPFVGVVWGFAGAERLRGAGVDRIATTADDLADFLK